MKPHTLEYKTPPRRPWIRTDPLWRPRASWPLSITAFALAAMTLHADAWPSPSPCAMCLAIVGWLVVGLMWCVRGFRDVPYYDRRQNRWWPLAPGLFVLTVAACALDISGRVTFALARPRLETAARAALLRPTTMPTPIDNGLYGQCQVEVIEGTAYVWVPGGDIVGFDLDGFAYSPSGPPSGHGHCQPLSGPWYRWHMKF